MTDGSMNILDIYEGIKELFLSYSLFSQASSYGAKG